MGCKTEGCNNTPNNNPRTKTPYPFCPACFKISRQTNNNKRKEFKSQVIRDASCLFSFTIKCKDGFFRARCQEDAANSGMCRFHQAGILDLKQVEVDESDSDADFPIKISTPKKQAQNQKNPPQKAQPQKPQKSKQKKTVLDDPASESESFSDEENISPHVGKKAIKAVQDDIDLSDSFSEDDFLPVEPVKSKKAKKASKKAAPKKAAKAKKAEKVPKKTAKAPKKAKKGKK